MRREPAATRRGTRAHFALAIILLAFAMFVVVTTEFVVVSLLPAMASDLKVSLAEAGWFVTWFALAAALLGPPLTMLAGRCDPRHVLVAAAIVFAAGNLAIALVPHYSVVVAVRVLQGCALPAIASVAIVAAARLAGARTRGVGNLARQCRRGRRDRAGHSRRRDGGGQGRLARELCGPRAARPCLGSSRRRLVSAHGSCEAAIDADGGLAAVAAGLPDASPAVGCHVHGDVCRLHLYRGACSVPWLHLDAATIAWALMGFGLAGVFGNWVAGRMVDRDPLAAAAWVALRSHAGYGGGRTRGEELVGYARRRCRVVGRRAHGGLRHQPGPRHEGRTRGAGLRHVAEYLGLQSGHRPWRSSRRSNRGPLWRRRGRLRRCRRRGGCSPRSDRDEGEPGAPAAACAPH